MNRSSAKFITTSAFLANIKVACCIMGHFENTTENIHRIFKYHLEEMKFSLKIQDQQLPKSTRDNSFNIIQIKTTKSEKTNHRTQIKKS